VRRADSDVQVVADPYLFLKRGPFASKHLLVQQDSWGAGGARSTGLVAMHMGSSWGGQP